MFAASVATTPNAPLPVFRSTAKPVSLLLLSCQARSISAVEKGVTASPNGPFGTLVAVGVGVGVGAGVGVGVGVGAGVGAGVGVGVGDAVPSVVALTFPVSDESPTALNACTRYVNDVDAVRPVSLYCVVFAGRVATTPKTPPDGMRSTIKPVSLLLLSCQARSISVEEIGAAVRLNGPLGTEPVGVGVGDGTPGVVTAIGVA